MPADTAMTAADVRAELQSRGWLSPDQAEALRRVIELERAETQRLIAELARSAAAMSALVTGPRAQPEPAPRPPQPLAIIRSVSQRGRTAAHIAIDRVDPAAQLYPGMPIYDRGTTRWQARLQQVAQ